MCSVKPACRTLFLLRSRAVAKIFLAPRNSIERSESFIRRSRVISSREPLPWTVDFWIFPSYTRLYAARDSNVHASALRLILECASIRRFLRFAKRPACLLQAKWETSLHGADAARSGRHADIRSSRKVSVLASDTDDDCGSQPRDCTEFCWRILCGPSKSSCVPRAVGSATAYFV